MIKQDILDIAKDGNTEIKVYYMMFKADGYTSEQVDEAFLELIEEKKIAIHMAGGSKGNWPVIPGGKLPNV